MSDTEVVNLYLRDLTKEQENKLNTLIKEVGEEYTKHDIEQRHVDFFQRQDYARFLRARKWVYKDAREMIIKALKWRTEHRVHEVTEEDIVSEYCKGKVYVKGFDKLGRIILFIKVKLHVTSESDPKIMEKLCIWITEQCAPILKPEAPNSAIIFDLNGFSLSNMVGLLHSTSLTHPTGL